MRAYAVSDGERFRVAENDCADDAVANLEEPESAFVEANE